jgi:hypothetical protein
MFAPTSAVRYLRGSMQARGRAVAEDVAAVLVGAAGESVAAHLQKAFKTWVSVARLYQTHGQLAMLTCRVAACWAIWMPLRNTVTQLYCVGTYFSPCPCECVAASVSGIP